MLPPVDECTMAVGDDQEMVGLHRTACEALVSVRSLNLMQTR